MQAEQSQDVVNIGSSNNDLFLLNIEHEGTECTLRFGFDEQKGAI